MPITIKKPEFKRFDKMYRKWAVVTALFSLALTVMLFVILRNISDDTSPAASVALFTVYALFTVSGMVTLKKAIDAYRFENNVAALLQSVLYCAVTVFCMMNLPFALVLLFEGIGKTDLSVKILGTRNYKEFIADQYYNWMCMLVGMALAMVLGVLGGHKLASNS